MNPLSRIPHPDAYIVNPPFCILHSLLETFNNIHVLDLHGNAKKKETAPARGKDENVFDIMQVVSINIFIKKRK